MFPPAEGIISVLKVRISLGIGYIPNVCARRIGTFYNAVPSQQRKNQVETWAQKAYPALWAELNTEVGRWLDDDWDIEYFKIDRTIKA